MFCSGLHVCWILPQIMAVSLLLRWCRIFAIGLLWETTTRHCGFPLCWSPMFTVGIPWLLVVLSNISLVASLMGRDGCANARLPGMACPLYSTLCSCNGRPQGACVYVLAERLSTEGEVGLEQELTNH